MLSYIVIALIYDQSIMYCDKVWTCVLVYCQVSGLNYLESLGTLLEATDPEVVKMLVYVQCVVSLLPYMPASIRSRAQDSGTGVEPVSAS